MPVVLVLMLKLGLAVLVLADMRQVVCFAGVVHKQLWLGLGQ